MGFGGWGVLTVWGLGFSGPGVLGFCAVKGP